jgi:hypothetical protein
VRNSPRVSPWIVPVLVLAAIGFGIGGARLFQAPSYSIDYVATGIRAGAERPTLSRFTVRGLRCVDTARTLSRQLEGVPGVLRCVCFASRNEARVEYDAARTDPQAIREAFEAPTFDSVRVEFLYNQYDVLDIDGRKVVDPAGEPEPDS